MDELLETIKSAFDTSPRSLGISEVTLDDEGNPDEAIVRYANPKMADTAHCAPEDLIGKSIYGIWPDGDIVWMEYFYRAAYFGESGEFETVNKAFKTFQTVSVFQVAPGYCGYHVDDVTKWISHAHPAMENIKAGMFFYEPSSKYLLLTDPARECCELEEGYFPVNEFVKRLFPYDTQIKILDGFLGFESNDDRVVYEECTNNGRWLRFSINRIGSTDRFAVGFLEDVTLMKEVEERSERRSEIIESLSLEYYALYIVNLLKDKISPYLLRNQHFEARAEQVDEHTRYSDWLSQYCKRYVVDDSNHDVERLLSREHLLRFMPESDGDFSVVCKREFEDGPEFIELRLIQVSKEADEFVLAARNVNEEIKNQILQKEALQTALTLAQHASDAKTTFLTNISHDFRTPLNSIMGFANLALADLGDDAQTKSSLEKILLSSEHLLDLINDILDVSRIESGNISIEEQEVDLCKLLADVNTVFTVQAAEKGIDFTIDYEGIEHNEVLCDQLRLNQILVNTIGNALKYTESGGRVSAVVKESSIAPHGAAMFEFNVKDTGCGMSDEFLDRIFMPFERDSERGAKNTEGTGLGMTITKNLVGLLGGTIDVKSELGEGSEFVISIPMKLAKHHRAEIVSSSLVESNGPIRLDGARILIVDDDELSREMVEVSLKKRGCEIEQACDGREAVELVERSEEGHYDAIIMDLRMPGMSGDAATRVIRGMSRQDVRDMPIIAMTADAFEEVHKRARDAGMTAHITKPLNFKRLIVLLRECLDAKLSEV